MNEIIKKVLMHTCSFEKENQNSKKQNIEDIFIKTN